MNLSTPLGLPYEEGSYCRSQINDPIIQSWWPHATQPPSWHNLKILRNILWHQDTQLDGATALCLLQVISQEEQWARTAFYEKHGIAFVARPPLGRRGVFKKASNLNYQLAITDRVAALAAEGLNPSQALLKVGGGSHSHSDRLCRQLQCFALKGL